MFCPPSYLSLNDLRDLCRTYVESEIDAGRIQLDASFDGSQLADRTMASMVYTERVLDVVLGWEEFTPHVCSPNGTILKIDVMPMFLDNFETYTIDDREYFLSLKNRFPLFDSVTGLIGFGNKKAASKFCRGFPEAGHILDSFSGWAICYPADGKPNCHKHLQERLVALPEYKRLAARQSKGGRPSELSNAFRSYKQAYPAGHKGLATWAEVEERTGYSESTLRRALALFEHQTG